MGQQSGKQKATYLVYVFRMCRATAGHAGRGRLFIFSLLFVTLISPPFKTAKQNHEKDCYQTHFGCPVVSLDQFSVAGHHDMEWFADLLGQ
jgi:hypothetical protein